MNRLYKWQPVEPGTVIMKDGGYNYLVVDENGDLKIYDEDCEPGVPLPEGYAVCRRVEPANNLSPIVSRKHWTDEEIERQVKRGGELSGIPSGIPGGVLRYEQVVGLCRIIRNDLLADLNDAIDAMCRMKADIAAIEKTLDNLIQERKNDASRRNDPTR